MILPRRPLPQATGSDKAEEGRKCPPSGKGEGERVNPAARERGVSPPGFPGLTEVSDSGRRGRPACRPGHASRDPPTDRDPPLQGSILEGGARGNGGGCGERTGSRGRFPVLIRSFLVCFLNRNRSRLTVDWIAIPKELVIP